MWRLAALLILAALILSAQGSFEGSVVNSVTGGPVPGATVELFAAGVKQAVNQTVTGVSGAFRFSDLPPGDYTPAFDADHYYAAHANEPWCKTFKVTSAGESVHVDAELQPITSISGRVLDPDGKPVVGFRVELQNRRMGMSLTTDHYGRFRLPEVSPGTYILLARPNRGMSLPANAKMTQPVTKDKTAWAPTYYPGVLDAAQAMRIRAAGGDLVGYDIQLRSVPVYRIRGTVRDEHGNPAEKMPVALTVGDIRDFASKPEAEAVTGAGGSFELTDVGPGNWRISVQTKRDGVDLEGYAVVTVSRHDEEDVQVRLAAAFPVDGSVAPDAGLKGLYLTAVDGPPRHDRYADVNSEGQFHVSNVFPGRYRINPSVAPGHYLAQVRLGEQDVNGQPLDLAPGGPPVRLIYRSDTGSLRGSVEKGANATVVFFPNDKSFPEIVRCKADGKFELGAVKPGDYSAVAFHRLELDLLQDAGFVQEVTRGAVSVHVDPGGSASVELRLTVSPQ